MTEGRRVKEERRVKRCEMYIVNTNWEAKRRADEEETKVRWRRR